jgi:hypothetical protein
MSQQVHSSDSEDSSLNERLLDDHEDKEPLIAGAVKSLN